MTDSTPTFDLAEIFPDQARADASDAANPPAYTATHRTVDGQTVTVNAWRGTQSIGRITREPINVTDFGRVELIITDRSGAVAVLDVGQYDDALAVDGLFTRGHNVADSRDETLDRYPTD